ncbi:Vi polysaccharide biosynthesis UDP-N-acetylglucosamine C-6 dehydrogenase TviB [Desulfofustis limnaeus]|jgi:UDP-N-acetyl-D-galactosamine dehydrogenase|uniref:Nucleotide sugar dehydrogenase n=1 Tax=Desulfofustis limnaeus TaxID=2740163 RepID=A0ABM7W8L1_9BACT|nr:Vi polysaccharide biosynthesis UDP-N-acetylglucosamine C-6 dehydrogenase TviB [Desulfofustis limnaeus]MDX9894355.1 Vi polysaccharide biosynthesis UDP-N-acetylglucosamine C-6 dehydrogenase TviB [Desulfofustis sp.]BDD87238.1 nucleotide sugar dehydrogenase [Desulfofustis limnaeus]
MGTSDAITIGVVGLGYVGLPLAVAFGKKLRTIGFDLKRQRIEELRQGIDVTREVDAGELAEATLLSFAEDSEALTSCNYFVVTVPTPIDNAKRPNLQPLVAASETVGRYLQPGAIVIYESTVYPGATEEVCVPILERVSGLRFNVDFFCGYSPERINPGDKQHRLTTIVKITSGSTEETAGKVDALYRSIIEAGTFRASSIKVAEAAKVIENTQRDVNIALVNELSMIFNRLGINTKEVLEAAGTKWNFLPFFPGLVGGHCIGVDPYYLTHKAQQVGYHPAMILAGRRLNDDMGKYVANRVIKLMIQRGLEVSGARILVLGLTFKENCPDLRNTRVIDIIDEFRDYHLHVDVVDPWVDGVEAMDEYGIAMVTEPQPAAYDAVVLAVGHREFVRLPIETIRGWMKDQAILFDVKQVLPAGCADGSL